MPLDELMKQVAGTLEHDSNARTVFGPSIELAHHVIVPVAVVTGGAAGGGAQPNTGGFAGALNVRPVGFIHESGDQVLFTPIHVDDRRRSLFSEAASGVRRVMDLAYQVVTQFVQGAPPKRRTPTNVQGDGVAVGSPS